MNRIGKAAHLVVFTCLLLGAPCVFAEEDAVADSIIEFMDFTEYQGGNILPEQIPAAEWKNFHVIDTRRKVDYDASHIPGAVHIEWRKLVSQREDIPTDKTVIVYCNTGSLSAQGAFALKVLGHDNVKVLTGGYDGFKSKGGLDAYERAQNPKF